MRLRRLAVATAVAASSLVVAAPAFAYDCNVAGVNCNLCMRMNEAREALGLEREGCPR